MLYGKERQGKEQAQRVHVKPQVSKYSRVILFAKIVDLALYHYHMETTEIAGDKMYQGKTFQVSE